MTNNINDWSTQVKEFNTQLLQQLNIQSNYKDHFYGFEVFDGPIIHNPKILFIGINPGKGNGEMRNVFSTNQLSYLDIYDENYRDDYPNTYHLAEKTVRFFKLMGWDDTKIQDTLRKRSIKTNFYHLATENLSDLKLVINDIDFGKEYFNKSAAFSIQLINIVKPKIVILEGKSVFDYIVGECYGKNVWNSNQYGYFFDTQNNTHLLGYSRGRNFTNEHRLHFINKLREVLM